MRHPHGSEERTAGTISGYKYLDILKFIFLTKYQLVPGAGAAGRPAPCGWSAGRKVCVHLDLGQLGPQPPDAAPGHILTVVPHK